MNDGHVAAKAFDNFQHVRSEKNGGAASDHILQHGFQRVGSDRVHALERLVEEKNFRAVDYGGGQGEFFLHAVRIVGYQRLGLVHQLHEIQQFGGAFGGRRAVQAVHAPDEIQILGTGETSEEGHAFGHDANLTFHFHGILRQINSENLHAPG